MLTTKLNKELLEEMGREITSFVGKIIDISGAPEALSSHLDVAWASSVGVTQKEMSVQVAEDRIHELAAKANIRVVCLAKQQVENDSELLAQLSPKWIVLLK